MKLKLFYTETTTTTKTKTKKKKPLLVEEKAHRMGENLCQLYM